MPFAPLIFEVVPFGEPVLGAWCEQCLLPSAVRQEMCGVTGMHVLCHVTVAACPECGWRTRA